MDQDTMLISHDEVGLRTLQYLSETRELNRWMFETISPYCTGRILEIGSGIGNISSEFVSNGEPLILSEFDTNYCRKLHNKFDREPLIKGIYQLDLVHPEFENIYCDLLNSFDTVFALNVIEHIANDKRAIANARSLLSRGGRLIILVPAYKALYNGIDRGLEHYRRYTRKSLKSLLSDGFNIQHTQYFNLAGILGWFVTGTIFRKQNLTEGPLSLYNKLVPLFRIADTLTLHRVGLSVIGVGQIK
jgi:SAM-dependent methyltransferase